MTAHVQLTERETLALLDCVRQADAQRVHYPPHLLAARRAAFRAAFLAQIDRRNREAEIMRALPTVDAATRNELIEELAEIITDEEKE
jgi:hypothetical protein